MSEESCISIQDAYPEHVDRPSFQIVVGFLYCTIFIFAFTGNLAVLYALKCKPINFNVRNVFIWSLTLADMSVCITSLPLTAIYMAARQWYFGEFMCILVPLFQASSVYITSFTVMAIAVDRYLLLCHPTGCQMNLNLAIGFIVLLWVLGIGASIPYAYVMKISSNVTYENGQNRTQFICGQFCDEDWKNPKSQNAYGIFALLVQFALPLVVCAVCYGQIVVSLKKNYIRRISEESTSLKSKIYLAVRRKRVNKMIGLMLMSFSFAWLPLNALNLFRDFSMIDNPWYSTIFAFGHIAAMSSLIWNPVIYSFCNDQFRALLNPANIGNCFDGRLSVYTADSRRSTLGYCMERSIVCSKSQQENIGNALDLQRKPNGNVRFSEPIIRLNRSFDNDNINEIFL